MSFSTLDDVIKYAVQREEEAYNLYNKAAAQTKSIAARKLFEEMAAEEAGHKEVFGKMDLERAEHYKKKTLPDMKISQFLVETPLKPDASYPEILAYAIKAEESAYNLYLAAADAIDDPGLEKVLRVFADVEKGHKIKVERIYEEHVLSEN